VKNVIVTRHPVNLEAVLNEQPVSLRQPARRFFGTCDANEKQRYNQRE
jgi:hypothetical protein